MSIKPLRQIIPLLLFLTGIYVNAQIITVNIPWKSDGNLHVNTLVNNNQLSLKNVNFKNNETPVFKYSIKTENDRKIKSIKLNIRKSADLNEIEKQRITNRLENMKYDYSSFQEGNETFHEIVFPAIIKDFRINTLEISIKWKSKLATPYPPQYPTNSPLGDGKWYKLKTLEKGVYKITGSQLKDYGINLSDINPERIKIFGENKGMLPEINAISRPLGLLENAIEVNDGGDNSFDNSDYILFYSAGPDNTYYDEANKVIRYKTNIYSDEAYYFLNFDLAFNGKRIQSIPSLPSAGSQNVTSYDAIWYHELQKTNLDKTGREWFGEKFDITKFYNFNINTPNRDINDSIFIEYRCIANNISDSSNVELSVNNTVLFSQYIKKINTNVVYPDKANENTSYLKTKASSSSLNLKLEFINNGVSNAFGYIDYILVNYRNKLVFNQDQTHFRDYKSHDIGGNATFNTSSSLSNFTVWNITENRNISNQTLTSGNFTINTDQLQEFIGFSPNNTLSVSDLTEIANQNLHKITQADYILIYPPEFKESASELKEFHETYSGYSVAFVSTEEIYNEFSSGRQDLAAIRDFIRMLYHRNLATNKQPQAVLLFGDASYDYKDYNQNNSNFIPTWEDQFSFRVTNSNATDDFIVCMDSLDGNMSQTSSVIDIPVGRFVIQTNDQGHDVVNKIKAYKNFDNRGSWQSRISLVTDDVDESWERKSLTLAANTVIDAFSKDNPNYNINKIYSDAYQQTNSSGGQRYPEVEKAITEAVTEGSLIVHYYGHGGEAGWATERTLDINAINSWENNKNLPAFVTTTCEFTRYDDLTRVSAGEYVHLNPNGGAIALFTSTRELNINDANIISRIFYKNLNLKDSLNNHLTMGEIFLRIKQEYTANNTRRFILIGDPGLSLNYPEKNINLTHLNNLDFTSSNIDTLKALSKISLKGEVVDFDSTLLSNFNGIANIQIFDKVRIKSTLNNDKVEDGNGIELEPIDFKTQTNKVFKGDVAVENGKFEVEFIVPKDIDFNIGNGRISIYAKSDTQDAWGSDTAIVVGSIISNPQEDNQGPEIRLFMNDSSFISGGITSNNPDIYAILSDANGINAVGTGVGHDISAILDEDSPNPIILNDFYKTFANSYTTGDVSYPLTDLEDGEHTLNLRAWDNYNNSNSAEITFIVARDDRFAIENVGNIPNPFSDLTDFQFEHNHENRDLRVKIEIFNTAGLLMKVVEKDVLNAQSRVNGELLWEGSNDYGSPLASGLYIYKLSVKSIKTGETAKKSEKLVIIK